MDSQLKRGMLDACVLTVLKKGKSYGYQMIKDMSVCIEVSESTLYPILRRLEVNKSLSVSTSEHSGRLRKYYEITESGIKELENFKKEWEEVVNVYNFILGKEGYKDE